MQIAKAKEINSSINLITERNLRNCRKFYQYFPDDKIWNACVQNLASAVFCLSCEHRQGYFTATGLHIP